MTFFSHPRVTKSTKESNPMKRKAMTSGMDIHFGRISRDTKPSVIKIIAVRYSRAPMMENKKMKETAKIPPHSLSILMIKGTFSGLLNILPNLPFNANLVLFIPLGNT